MKFKDYLIELNDEDQQHNPGNQDQAVGDDVTDDTDDESFYNPSPDVDSLGDDEEQSSDPDRQGVIRHVAGAHLVFKRQTNEGTFDELWIYKIQPGMKDETNIRRNILAGTDIEPGKTKSEDGNQQMDLWSVGNVQFLNITGLPN